MVKLSRIFACCICLIKSIRSFKVIHIRCFSAFTYSLLDRHKDSLKELIQRDKNRPSVIMWSLANDPDTSTDLASLYFQEIVKHVKCIDCTRPVTISINSVFDRDFVGHHLDVVSFNRYNAWYLNIGQLNRISENVIQEAAAWHKKYNKPVFITEYGADTIAGLHNNPVFAWSEEYQVAVMTEHFKAFDVLRQCKWFVGEHIWNFADYQTKQSYISAGGDKKGLFTRNRQPKMGAHYLRKRYFLIAQELYNVTVPDDLYEYLASRPSRHDGL